MQQKQKKQNVMQRQRNYSSIHFDLLSVVIIRRGKEDSNVEVLDYLNGVFSSNIEQMCKYVDIRKNETIMKGVNAMCGLGASIRDEGRAEEKENMVLEMLKKNLSLELISDISKLSLEEIKQIQEKSLIAN